MTEILNGHPVARHIETDLIRRVASLGNQGSLPGLAVVLFGDDSPSQVYGNMILRGCKRVGISCHLRKLSGDLTPPEAEGFIEELNQNPSIHGILIKRPLPGTLSDESILQCTTPAKDVDGYHFENVGRLMVRGVSFAPVPCTPAGVLELLRRTGHPPAGKNVVVLGRSTTVGKPLATLLGQKEDWANATVTLCHRHTSDLSSHTRRADFVVTAVGQPQFLTREMISEDAVVVDVGTNVIEDSQAEKGYRLVGDADFESLNGYCRAITPVPGGVGPVTVAMLLKNVVKAAEVNQASGNS